MELEKWYDAIDNNKMKQIKKMINNGFDVGIDNDYALRRAAYNGNLELIKLLFKNGANINVGKGYSIRVCIRRRYLDCVKYLIKCRINLPTTCLRIVSRNEGFCCVKIVKILVENGAELDTGNNNLLSILLLKDQDELVKDLINKGLVIYDNSSCNLLYSNEITDKRYEIIEILLKNGLDATNLIYHFMIGDNEDAIKLLFEYGANVKKLNLERFIFVFKSYYSKINEWTIDYLGQKGLPKKFFEEMLRISRDVKDNEIAEYIEKFL